jgi:ParB-like chromosome segregation protein Spo0J
MKSEWLALNDIEVGERKRPLNEANVQCLMASIKEIGLQAPITVMERRDERGGEYFLVAGLHRLEALRRLGEEGATCILLPDDEEVAELWEIDENLARAELSDAQRADHHARREAILVRRGEVLDGAGRPSNSAKSAELTSYSKQAAGSLGISERTVRQDLARGKKITPDVLADVTGTALDKGVVLDELARTDPADQRAKLAEITLRRQEAERVRKDAEGANRATDRVIAMTDAESAASMILARFDLAEVDGLIALLANVKTADLIAAIKRGAA